MADEEQLNILKQGIEIWNQFDKNIHGNVVIQQIQHVEGGVTGQDKITGNREQRAITTGRDYVERIEDADVKAGNSEKKGE